MLNNLTLKKDIRTFSVCPENPTGKKGAAAMATLEEGTAAHASRELGQGWKVNPYLVIQPGETAVYEDSVYAVSTAHAAGFYVVAIHDGPQNEAFWDEMVFLSDEAIVDWTLA